MILTDGQLIGIYFKETSKIFSLVFFIIILRYISFIRTDRAWNMGHSVRRIREDIEDRRHIDGYSKAPGTEI